MYQESLEALLPTATTPRPALRYRQQTEDQENRLQSLSGPSMQEGSLDFGRSVIQAHGNEPSLCSVINCSDFMLDITAGQPVIDPRADVYLGFLGLPTAASGDSILSLRCLPGLLDYYREAGLLSPDSRVIEFDPPLDQEACGYPRTSPLAMLIGRPDIQHDLQQSCPSERPPMLVATFLTPAMQTALESVGINSVQRANPALSNNKYLFARASESFGYQVMPSIALRRAADEQQGIELILETINSRLARGESPVENMWTGAWLKLAGGSGGDFVSRIAISSQAVLNYQHTGDAKPIREEARQALALARQRIRNGTSLAFQRNHYGADAAEAFWPADSYGPAQSTLLLEQDIHAHGTVLANASNMMLLNQSGHCSVEGFFQQLTGPEGDYRGSMPFDPMRVYGPAAVKDLYQQLDGVASLACELGLRGYIGVDFFVIRDDDGNIVNRMTELNGRISISGTAQIIASKLAAPAWINVNLRADRDILSVDDFKQAFGQLAEFRPGDFSECRVVPQAFRSLFSQSPAGMTAIPSPVFKALIVGPTQAACQTCMNQLYQAGFGK